MVSPSGAPSGQAPAKKFRSVWAHLAYIYNKEIWQTSLLKERTPRGIVYAVLRVVSISITVFNESRASSRAAALTFSSLLGLGPLIAIAVLVGGFMLGNDTDSKTIANKIGTIMETVAPQLKYLKTTNDAGSPDAQPGGTTVQTNQAVPTGEGASAAASTKTDEKEGAGALVSEESVFFVQKIIEQAQSGIGAGFGAISFITIVLLLFKSIEDAFNDIWGVRTGRSVMVRVVFYWTILTLGAVVFFAAIAAMTTGVAIKVFGDGASAAAEVAAQTAGTLPPAPPTAYDVFLRWALIPVSVTLLVALLTLVYRTVPNTRVFWRAAFCGGIISAALLLLNQYVALFYVQRVVQTKSLYGSVALPMVLMLGLYVVWIYLLIGAIVSYAVQNVHFRNSQAAWSTLPEQTRERLSLVVFLTICRRFRECMPAISASELSGMLKVPTQLVNECLGRLEKLKLVTPIKPNPEENENDSRYQPTRPLNRTTLFDFKTLDDNYGENALGSSLEHIDPILAHYDAAISRIGEDGFFQKPIDELFAEHPFDQSRPPFSMGGRSAQ